MLKLVAQIFLVCTTSGIIFIVIASVSFSYYVEKHKPDAQTIEGFLKRLRFPADRVIGFLPTGRINSAVEALVSEPPEYTRYTRAICAGILIIHLVFWGWMVLRQTDLASIIGNAIILIYMAVVSYFSWRFGHKLRPIK